MQPKETCYAVTVALVEEDGSGDVLIQQAGATVRLTTIQVPMLCQMLSRLAVFSLSREVPSEYAQSLPLIEEKSNA